MFQIRHTIKQGARSVWKKLSRRLLKGVLIFQPEEKKVAAERRLRGREQVRKLKASDVVVVSFGKSGRTWVRVMLSRVYQTMYGLSERAMIGFDNFHSMNAAIPKIFFTHDNYIKDYTDHTDSKVDFYDKEVVLLARDPRDVAVSQFFQWQYRMKPGKKVLNKYPREGADVGIFDFIMDEDAGLPHIIRFMNLWASEADEVKSFFLLRYEDLRTDPEGTLRRLMEFMGSPATDEQIKDAVEYSSYENMKKMEQKNTFWLSGGRMVPKDKNNPNSFKVRRAKVGGYLDYFDDQQVEAIEQLMESTLSPYFGYGRREAPKEETKTS
jgi:hypothetical protein